MSRFFVFLLVSTYCCQQVCAQIHDSITEVQITEQRVKDSLNDVKLQFTAGQQQQPIATLYQSLYETQSLVDLLTQQSPVFIKSYGVNGMATLSFRGASAAQSAAYWNGIPIVNPALGVADISLLSTGLFDYISLQYGGSAALFGSGNVGGALMLATDKADFKPLRKIAATFGTGSFGRLHIATKAQYQDDRIRLSLSMFYQQLRNNFPYDDAGRRQYMDHATLKAGGGLAAVDMRLGRRAWEPHNNHTLSFQLWMQQHNRQIPPALFEQESLKYQQDGSFRSFLQWQRTTRRQHFYITTSFSREYLRYDDAAIPLNNRNVVSQYYQEAGWRWRIHQPKSSGSYFSRGSHSLLLFAPLQFSVASGAHISNKETQWRPAIAGSVHFQSADKRLAANAAFRQEWVNGVVNPLLPGAGMSYALFSESGNDRLYQLVIRGNVQRTFRTPNLNELYYFPGGNPDLKPEQGWTTDAGYAFVYRNNKKENRLFSFQHDLAVFHREIQDWIYWLGGNIWTPHNIASVHSRGVETDNRLEYQPGVNWNIHLSLKTAYVLATTLSSYLPHDNSINKQIPYTPRYNGQTNIGFDFRSLFFNYNHTYTGYRFTTIDESHYLLPYQTGNVQLMYTFKKDAYLIRVSAQVQNIWGATYEVVNARPMPNRNYVLSMHLGWKQ